MDLFYSEFFLDRCGSLTIFLDRLIADNFYGSLRIAEDH